MRDPTGIAPAKGGFGRTLRLAPAGGWSSMALTGLVALAPLVLCLLYGKITYDIVVEGASQFSWEYLLDDPKHSGRAGGVLPIIVSTVIVLFIAVASAVPISLAAALYVTEYLPKSSTRLLNMFRACMLVLAGIPSIAFGLFGSAIFGQWMGMGNSLLSGGLTLGVMIIPICVFTFEEVFRMMPSGYRLGAHALGSSKPRLIVFVLLPAALPGLVSAVLLGMGRALAETAALLFTSGYSTRMPESVLDPGRVLSIHIYDLAMNIPGGESRAAAAALLIMGLFLMISSAAIFVSVVYGKKIGASK